MPLQEQGVRLSVEGERQFLSAMQKAQGSVDGFSKSAHGPTKSLTAGSMALATAMGQALYNGAMAAGRAISGFMSDAVTGASDLAETTSKIGIVFGDASGQILELGDTAATSFGMSANTALTAAGTYGNLFRSMGIGEQKSADMSESLLGLAGDLASFNNLTPEEVLEKLRAGLTGEAEPLKSLGIDINEVTLKEKAMELGLYSGKGALDAGAKAQAAYALMLEQTTLAQGDFARTSDRLANQQRIAAANVENLKAKLGTALLPMVTAVTKGFNKFVESPFFKGALQKVIDGIDRFADSLEGVFEKISSGDFKGAFKELTSGIDIGSLFKSIFSGANDFDFGTFAGDIIGKLLAGLVSKPAKILETGLTILNTLAGAIANAVPTLLPVFIQLLNSMVTFIVSNLPILIDSGLEIILTLLDAIVSAIPTLLTAAVKIIPMLIKGIVDTVPKLIDAAVELIPVIITTLLDSLPMIITAALEIILTLANGLIEAIPVLLPMVPEIVISIFDAIITSLPIIAEAAVELVLTLIDGIIGLLPVIGKEAGKLVTSIGQGISKLIPTLLNVGKDIVVGLWEGIKSKGTWLVDNVKSFFQGILDGVKNIFKAHSESQVMVELGVDVVNGFGSGIKDMAKIASKSKVFDSLGANMMLGLKSGVLRTLAAPAQAMAFAAKSMVTAVSPAPIQNFGGQYNVPSPVNVSVNANVSNEVDYYKLARRVADEIRLAR